MRVVMTGATGFIGLPLRSRLLAEGHSVVVLSRSPAPVQPVANLKWITWEPGKPNGWEEALDGADGVINLAGEPIPAKRWTAAQKEKIRTSRVETTRALVGAIGKATLKPKVLLNASAIGYYGPRDDETVVEETEPGKDFVSRVCIEWESEAKKAEAYGVRVVRLRTGIVLGRGGGALAKMLMPFKLFIGGPLGTGRQWFSWIQLDDEIGLILYLLDHDDASGPVNFTAPNPVTMKEFCRSLGKVLGRPSWAPVPSFMLRLLLGEMADVVLTGQRVLPQKALKLGYTFKYPDLANALRASV